jgi:hypothetical protein
MEDEAIKETINGIFGAFLSDGMDTAGKLLEAIKDSDDIKHATKALKDNDPDVFSCFTMFLDDIKEHLVRTHFDDTSKFYRRYFLYLHYSFFESHARELISKYEGMACSSDKVSTIARSINKWITTGKDIKFNYDQEYTFHLPKTVLNTHESIVDFFEALYSLHNGNPEKYLKFLKDHVITIEDKQ